MGTEQHLISHTKAARILDITRRHLWRLVRQGIIFPAKRGDGVREALYRPEEIYAVLEMRKSKLSLDMPSVAAMALQAQALSRSVEGRLRSLCRLLGIVENRLRRDEESMFDLHQRVRNTLEEDLSTMTSASIIEWASIFNSIDEAYLTVLEVFTNDPNPWQRYMLLANTLMVHRNPAEDAGVSFAYACLDSSRRNLRHAAYFYVFAKNGQRTADNLFTKEAATEEVIAQLFPHAIN